MSAVQLAHGATVLARPRRQPGGADLWRALLSRHVTSPDRLAEPDVGGDAGSALWRAWAVKMLPEVAPSGTLTIQFRPRGPISRSVLAAIPDQREQQRCASQKSRYLCAQNSTINSRKPSMNRTDPCGSFVLPTLTPGPAPAHLAIRARAQEYRTSRPAAQKRSPRRTNCQCLRRVRREPLCPRRGHRGPGSVRCVRALLQCGLLAASGCNMA